MFILKNCFFSLRYDIYQFIEDHWESLDCGKEKNSTWKQTVKMTLSRYNKLFENGYHKLQKRGFWKVKDCVEPIPIPTSAPSNEQMICAYIADFKLNEVINLDEEKIKDSLFFNNDTWVENNRLEIPIPQPKQTTKLDKPFQYYMVGKIPMQNGFNDIPQPETSIYSIKKDHVEQPLNMCKISISYITS